MTSIWFLICKWSFIVVLCSFVAFILYRIIPAMIKDWKRQIAEIQELRKQIKDEKRKD